MAREEFDVLVVGGGVTGTGAAVDAATRGLRVALIEARDYAAGASSKSSKLIHGGLRYLEMLDFGLVREALRERRLLLTELAPHLVRPVPFLWPLTHRWWERPYVGAGLILYDTMGGRRAVPRARHLSRAGALRVAPGLRPDALVGGVQFYDAQEDDARMVAFLARTAAASGAALATGIRAETLITEGGRVRGVRARDLIGGCDLVIRARQVAMAAGAWTGTVAHGPAPAGPAPVDPVAPAGPALVDPVAPAGPALVDPVAADPAPVGPAPVGPAPVGPASVGPAGQLRVRPSKGIHIVIPRSRIRMDTGLLTRTEKSVLFVIPWGEHWLIGDTDTEWDYDPAYPAASRADIEYLLAKANHLLRDPITVADIEGVFAGLRPLVAAASADTTRLSREHTVDTATPGLTTIAGGKFTTYRVMARDLIDAAAHDLGPDVPPSRTHEVPLVGAVGYPQRWAARDHIAAASGLSVAQVERLLGRYGSCIDDLLELIAGRPGLGTPLPGAGGYLAAEVSYACTHEGALHLDDVLARRTRIAFELADRGIAAAPQAAALMAAELGWDAARTSQEVARYRDGIAAMLAAEQAPDDALAFQARLGGPGAAAL
jgi:glycerol-3-phosphate dehydrogenase